MDWLTHEFSAVASKRTGGGEDGMFLPTVLKAEFALGEQRQAKLPSLPSCTLNDTLSVSTVRVWKINIIFSLEQLLKCYSLQEGSLRRTTVFIHVE